MSDTAQTKRANGRAVPAVKRITRLMLPHPLYRRYRQWRVSRIVASYPPRLVTHDYGGQSLHVRLTDPLSEAWYDHDWPRLPEIDELVRVGALFPGANVFDIGAHHGVVALMLAAEVGPSGRLVAVEAEPHNASAAAENVRSNGAENVLVLSAAIADRPGTLYFAEGLDGHVDSHQTRTGNVEVTAVTIDQLAEQHGRPDLVFLDVEGYEGKALLGATETLAARRTAFFVEVHSPWLVDFDCSVEEVLAHFDGFEMRVALLQENGESVEFVPLARTPSSNHRFNLICVPENNTGQAEEHAPTP